MSLHSKSYQGLKAGVRALSLDERSFLICALETEAKLSDDCRLATTLATKLGLELRI